MSIGTATNVGNPGQAYQSPSPVSIPSLPSSVASSPMPAMQTTFPLLASSPLVPLLDAPDVAGNKQRTTNLVNPSLFIVPPPVVTAAVSSIPTAPPLNPATSLQRPYGAPLLQPFPPPNPPPSLTPVSVPAANYGPVISREKVRDALLVLVQVSFLLSILHNILCSIYDNMSVSDHQDNQFIDMVYRALLNAHTS
ncbi:mRNA-decapping enzyme-like protein [Linum grandiflorum]